jgi:catalase (peroxidase I)
MWRGIIDGRYEWREEIRSSDSRRGEARRSCNVDYLASHVDLVFVSLMEKP